MQITIEHLPTQNTWSMSVLDIDTGLKNMETLKNRESVAGFSFYSSKICNHIHIPAKIANECVYYLVSESSDEIEQMKEYFE